MGLRTATFVVAVATVLAGLAAADYSSRDRPRIVLDNGNMVFQVPRSRNITFRTSSGRGGIFLNGRDVADVLDKVAEASRTLEPITSNNQLQTLGETVESVATLRTEVTELKEKCQTLQTQVRRLTTNLTRVLRVPLMRLQRQVRNLRSSLTQDPCRSNPCSHGGTCIGRYNAFTCLCPPAWEGPRCEVDVDECSHYAGSDLGCQNNARCINTPGSYRCECAQGFYGARCTQHEASCTTATSSSLCDHGTCVSLPQTNNPPYMCLCEQGWTKGFGQPACSVDVDECATGHHFCSRNPPVACINFPGGFGCGPCPSGYSGDGYSCADIDECLTNNGGCSQNPRVDCFNTVGSRFCGPCPPGYVGDGVTCSYVGACNVNNGGCSPLARCIVRSGGFHECLCPPGYVGGGVGASGCVPQGEPGGVVVPSPVQPPLLDPCAARPCSHGFCQPRGNDFVCICETGYSGRLCDRTRDACASEPCHNNGTCMSGQGGSFACSCTPEWTGATCDEPRQSCEDTLYGLNGTLRYPETGGQYAHKRDCTWIIHTSQEKVLNLTFPVFHLEEGHECAFDYLEVHDGPTSNRRTIGRYCGTTLSGTSIVSGQPAVYLHFHSDSSVAGDGFTMEWTSVEPQCGKTMPEANVGSVSSPGYPDHYPSNRNCTWTLTVAAGKRIQLHLATVQMEHHPNCSFDYLKIYDGANDGDRLLATFCGTNNSASERPILSSGHNMLVQFHSDESSTDTGFFATYAAVPAVPGCGGVMSRDKGRFSSPGHPSPYENGLLCEWEIRAQPGERVRLSFDRFELEGHPSCRWDALEIFDGRDDRSPLLRRACGDSMPPPVTSSGDALFIRFKTDENTQLQGFSAIYEAVCGGRWTGLQGELTSPRYPAVYPRNRHCNYTIVLPPGNVVQLAVQTFDVERDEGCGYDYLEISEPARNGSMSRIGRYCGNTPPPVVTSSYNQMRLVFHTDHSNEHHGFMANYTAVDVGCGGVLTEAGSLMSPAAHSASSADTDADSSGAVAAAYRHNLMCRWILSAPPGHTVRLSFSHFVLEDAPNCSYDYLEVHDTSDQKIGRYCGLKMPPTLTSSGRQLQVIFRTDDSVTRDGFLAHFMFLNERSACGGDFYLSQGVVRSPLYPRPYLSERDCVWVLHAPDNRQIRLNFTHFDIASEDTCRASYLEILNGGQATSPLAGRFCKRSPPSYFVSDTNTLRLHFVSGSNEPGTGFEVYYDSALSGCGGTTGGTSGSIVSPNYPQPYGHNAECRWNIRVNEGSRVSLMVVDMDIEMHANCRYDTLEIYDGPSDLSKRLSQLCNDQQRPGALVSTGRDMFLRFRTDASAAGRGFHVVYTTMCNVRIVNQPYGVIESPNYPEPSPHNANCTWTIETLSGHNISIAFSFLELEYHNNCTYDYVEINETDSDGLPKRLGRFCGDSSLPAPVLSTKNIVTVHFVTDGSISSRGFRLEFASRGCGGVLTKRSGTIETPNYPHGYPKNSECLWVIKAPLGQRVQLSFHDMHLESATGCAFDFVRVFGGPDISSPKLAEICSSSSSTSELVSHGNTMAVHFRSDSSIQGKGFRASYNFDRRGCGGRFSTPSAVIMSPGYPANYDAQDDCSWEIRVAEGHVVKLQMIDFSMPASVNCTDSYLAVYDNMRSGDKLLLRHCGDSLPQPVNITSSGSKLRLRMKASGSSAGKGFKARYTTECGATLNADTSGTISTPEYPHFSPESDCSWIISTSQPDEQVILTITHLNMPRSDCDPSNVTLRDGDSAQAPVLRTLCTAELPAAIVSRGGALFVRATHVIMRAVYAALHSGCGAEIDSLDGNVASPGYPDTYLPSQDCVWLINAAKGNMMQLTFSAFTLEDSEFCNKDYLEVRERSAHGRLLGRFCGSEIPMNITRANGLWLKFHSDDTDVASGFSAHFSTLRKVDLEGTSGVIESPLFPHETVAVGDFTWTIHVPDDLYPRISWDQMYATDTECWASKLIVVEGVDEGSPQAATYCGSQKPDPLVLRTSHVQLRFSSTGGYSKWRMQWEAVNSSYLQTMDQAKASSACSYRIDLANASSVVNITSPGFPEKYGDDLNCTWSVVAPPMRTSQITFNVVDLRSWESIDNCFYDYVTVYDVNPSSSPERRSLRQICGQIPVQSDLPAALASSTRFMAVRLLTVGNDRPEVIGRGFSARVRSVCGGNISEPQGVLQDSDVLDSELRCYWHIYSDRRMPLKITLESINLPADGGACRETFIQVLNGGQSDSPPLGQGKFCGSSSRPQELQKTSSPSAFIIYRRRTPQKGQFRLRWEEAGITCGGPIQLSRETKTREVSSPGYPHAGPTHSVTCDWTIRGPPRSRIRIDFPDSFHMRHGCHGEGADERRADYVEVFDGGTANAPSLKIFCGSDVGDSLVSSGNLMALRYIQTGAAGDFLGFRANVMLAECGGTLWPFSGRSRNLEELREKLIRGANFDCAWQLRSMDQTLVALSVKGLSLSESPGCTGMDFLEVRDGNRTGPVLAQICGANSSLDVQSSENSMFLRVKLSSGTRHNPRTLMLRWHSEFSQCGGELTAPQGVFSSPGYPNALEERRHCYWTIAAPEGRRVSLTIEGNINDCTTMLQVMERFYRRTVECGHSLPVTYESFKSRVVLSYTFQRLAGGQGIRVTYDTEKELPCWQTLTERSGTLESPAEALVAGSHYACEWTLGLQLNQTLAVTLDRINVTVPDNANCKTEFLHISRRLCKPGDREVTLSDSENSAPSTTAIHYSKGHNQTSGGFSATYRVNDCGGRVRISDNTEFIATPRFPENYSPNTDCVWIVEPEVWGTQIKLNFSSFALEDNCSADWLDVKSGNNGLAPSINKYCGQRSPGTLVGTAFMLIFHADGMGTAKGFNISATAVGVACGGLVHGRGEQSLQSPNYPERYPPNAECDWTVDVQRGYRARLAFRGRFDIEASTGCTADYVKVFNERADGQWEPNPVGSFCGLEAPEPIEATTHRARVLFRSNAGVEADGFNMIVTKACGDRYEDDEGEITSPRFPDNYANNLNCPYFIVVPEGSHLELSFDKENFEIENADSCKYDNLTLYEGNSTSSPVLGGPWCGTTAPGNYSVASSVLVLFRTDWSSAGKGFRLQYRISRCGGNLTGESGSFSMLPSMAEGDNSPRCKWNIRVAEGRVVELRLQLADSQHGTVHSTDCTDGFVSSRVQVLDGEGDDAAPIALFCGREGGPDIFKSTGRSMTVVLAMNTMYVIGTGFRASYRSTLGVNQGCGGTLLQASGVISPPSLSGTGNYPGGPLNCLWTIVSRSGYGLELNVTALNLDNGTQPCNAASTEFLEVWDSLDEQQEPLIRLCGQRPPEAPLRSAGNTLLVHMVTKDLGEKPAFSAAFRELPPLCGGTLNVSGDAWQTLQSPGFPSGSPSNVRCLWVLRGQESVTFNGVPHIGTYGEGEFRDVIIRVKEMRLPCEDGAYLALITDEKYSDQRPLRLCGMSAPQEWLKPHAAASRVQLLLDTGRRGGQVKLKLEYGTMRDANLTYSQPSGIIHNVDYPGWTTTAAHPTLLTVAPANTTAMSALALYFIRFNVGSPVNNSCPNAFMQVRDGGASSRVLSHVCGDINPGPVFSTGVHLSIIVKNAQSNQIQSGWSHRYLMMYFSSPAGAPAGCGGNVTASEGALSSPGYPETFKQSATCVWYLTGRARATLQLSFVAFAFNSSASACDANYLDIYNGHRDSPDAKITRLCGQDMPATLQSTGSQLLVKMVTDEKNSGPGFYARFKAVYDDQRIRIGLPSSESTTTTPSPQPAVQIQF